VGREATMVRRLEPLVDAYPYRELLWALLMVALCGTGRQADALAAYGRARARLREDLGIEPGPQLRQLQRDILSGRAAGRTGNADGFWFAGTAAPSQPGSTGGGPVPLPRPAPRHHLTS